MAGTDGGLVRCSGLMISQRIGTSGTSTPNMWFGVAANPNGVLLGRAGDRAMLLGGTAVWICSGGNVWVNQADLPPTAAGQVGHAVASFNPSANVAERAVGNHNLGVDLPQGVIVTGNLFYRIRTDLTSAGNLATLGFGYTVDDVVGLIPSRAINDASAPWTAGVNPFRNRNYVASGNMPVLFSVPTTGVRSLQVTVGVEPLLTGRVEFYVPYVILGT